MTKPFALAEVIARVHAILRRTGYEPEDDGILRFSDLELDERRTRCAEVGAPSISPRPNSTSCVGFMLNPRPRAVEGPDPRSRLALRLRWRWERRRNLRQLSAQEARAEIPGRRSSTPSVSSATRCGSRSRLVMARVSLRLRLLLAVGAIAIVALVVADFATYSALRTSLYNQVDQQLAQNRSHLFRTPTGLVFNGCRAPAELRRRRRRRRRRSRDGWNSGNSGNSGTGPTPGDRRFSQHLLRELLRSGERQKERRGQQCRVPGLCRRPSLPSPVARAHDRIHYPTRRVAGRLLHHRLRHTRRPELPGARREAQRQLGAGPGTTSR